MAAGAQAAKTMLARTKAAKTAYSFFMCDLSSLLRIHKSVSTRFTKIGLNKYTMIYGNEQECCRARNQACRRVIFGVMEEKTKIKRLRVSAHRRFVSNRFQRDFQASCFFDSTRLTPAS
jgi:hypothetical protein